MRMVYDKGLGKLVSRKGYSSLLTSIAVKRGDSAKIDLDVVLDDATVGFTGAPTEVRFVVKADFDEASPVLLLADTFVEASGLWSGPLLADYEGLQTLLGLAASVTLKGELTFTDGDGVQTSQTVAVVVSNDIWKGTEGTPLSLPSPDEWLAARASPLPQELDYAPLNAAETGLVIPDVELQTALSAPFYLDTPRFLLFSPALGSDDYGLPWAVHYGDDQWEVYPDGGNWIFYYTDHGAVWTGAPAANAVDSALAVGGAAPEGVGDGGNSFGNFQPQVVTRPKTTGTLATFNGRLYANHGTDDLPDWQEVVLPVEIANFVTRTGASQTVSSPKVFSGANLHSGPNIFTQPVTATNPATAASHLLDRATADARYGQTIAAVTTESVAITSSDTLQDHLEIIIPTTGSWKMEARVMMAGTENNGKIKQTGMGNIFDTGIRRTSAAAAVNNITSPLSGNTFMGYEGIYYVPSVPHTVKIQISQNTSSETASTFRRGNYLIAQKIG